MEETINKIFKGIGTVMLILVIFLLGFYSNDLYRDIKADRIYNGLHMYGYNKTYMLSTAQSYDNLGDWVCVNIKGMDYEIAFETCMHEVSHEMFAKECSKNGIEGFKKCVEMSNDEEV